MANIFVNLPSQAGNGSGAAVDVSAFGASKTITVAGPWPATLQPTVIVEVNNAAVATDGSWAPIASFQGQGTKIQLVAARWMRVTVSGYRGGPAPDVNVGGVDSGTSFANLPATAGNGTGAGVDVTALGEYKSIHVGGTFRGTVTVEISEDSGATYQTVTSFQSPGLVSEVFAATHMRVRRSGVPTNLPGLPVVNIGAVDPASGATYVPPYVDLRDAPFNVVANPVFDAAEAAQNTTGINLAIATYNGLGACLMLPDGNIWLAQAGALNWSIKFGAGVNNLNLVGQGMFATTLIQNGVGDAGEWAAIDFDLCSNIYVGKLGIKCGVIEKPDPAQLNFLTVFHNSSVSVTPEYTEYVELDEIYYGKTFGDAVAFRGGPTWPVRRVIVNNFQMHLAGSSMRDWAPLTPYTQNDQVDTALYSWRCLLDGISGALGPEVVAGGNGTFAFATFTVTSIAGNVFTKVAHGFQTGDGPVRFTGAVPNPIVVGTNYWVIAIDADNFMLAANVDLAVAGTNIVLTTAGANPDCEDTSATKHVVLDGSVTWVATNGIRFAARAGISFQGGYEDIEIGNGLIADAQNAPVDMESSSVGVRVRPYLHDVVVDNRLGNTSIAASFGSTALDTAKGLRVHDCVFLEGRLAITYTEYAEFVNCQVIITEALNADPTMPNIEVRGTNTDLRFINMDVQRLGGTAGKLLDIEDTSRVTIDGGNWVQNTNEFCLFVDGVNDLIVRNNPRIYYTAAAGAAGRSGLYVAATARDGNNPDINGVTVDCTTGTLRSAVELQVRAPRSMNNISVRNVQANDEASYAVIIGVGVAATVDRNPLFSGCAGGVTAVWRQEDAGENPILTMFPVTAGNKGPFTARMIEGEVAPNGAVLGNLGDMYNYRLLAAVVTSRWIKTTETVAGTPDNTGWEMVKGSTISPAAIGAGPTADYAPAGVDEAECIRQATSAGAVVSGLLVATAARGNRRRITWQNISANTLTLNHEDLASAAANRFDLPGAANLVVVAGGSVTLWYDLLSARWRVEQ